MIVLIAGCLVTPGFWTRGKWLTGLHPVLTPTRHAGRPGRDPRTSKDIASHRCGVHWEGACGSGMTPPFFHGTRRAASATERCPETGYGSRGRGWTLQVPIMRPLKPHS